MPGTTYTVPPIPPDAEHTTYVDGGTLRLGVEYRLLDEAELAANYVGEAMDEIEAHKKTETVEDNGVSIHVLGAADGHEYLRFDCFASEPHYHYILPSGEEQTIVDFDPVAHGDMLPWTFHQLRTRLGPMLERAGGGTLVPQIEPKPLEAALKETERLAREAEAALAREPRTR